MRFREVERNIDELTELDRREKEINRIMEEFRKIKPETDITIEESREFWNSIFMNGEGS